MPLREEMARSGSYLFRWRSYLPLVLLSIALFTLKDFQYLGNSEALDDLWEVFCVSISFAGLAVRCLVIGFVPANTSGRNTRKQVAATLNTTGMYSLMRHPLYFGNLLMWLGLSLFAHTWWLVLTSVLAFWIYYERIMFAEEEFLRERFGREFEDWAQRTPAFFPRLRSWKPPELPFSWKTVLKGEYSGLFAMISTFTVLEVVGDYFAGEPLYLDLEWAIFFFAGLGIYGTLRWLKRHKYLSVKGR